MPIRMMPIMAALHPGTLLWVHSGSTRPIPEFRSPISFLFLWSWCLALLNHVLQTGEPHGHAISVGVGDGVHACRSFDLTLEPCRDDTGQVCSVLTGVDTTGLRRSRRLMSAQRALIE